MKLYLITAVLLSGSLIWTLVTGVPFDDKIQHQQYNDDNGLDDPISFDIDDEVVVDNTDESEVPSFETCAALYPECRTEVKSDTLLRFQGSAYCTPTVCTGCKSRSTFYIHFTNTLLISISLNLYYFYIAKECGYNFIETFKLTD